jgi:class 3 adenylate cyclase/tetratricopeptide (TPR) repeat protein
MTTDAGRRGSPTDGEQRVLLTFLLTDVVGSTALWDTAPAEMSIALRRHDELVAQVIAAHDGNLVRPRGEGDSAFCVFASPLAAVTAAVALQQAFAAEPWPHEAPIVVRMGLHSGEAIARADDYYGSTVNRAARIRALALGRQVLISESTAERVESSLGPGVDLVELGTRKLAGLLRPERIYAVLAPGLLGVAPDIAARAVGVVPLSPGIAAAAEVELFGRDMELGRARELFDESCEHGEARVVLISGDAGIGKTSLAAHIAAELHDAGASVLYGEADDALGLAYQPFVRAVSALVGHLPPEDLAVHVANHGAQLAQLVPELGRRTGVTPSTAALSAETDRYLLFAAVAHLLALEALARPVVLVLEDLHWADLQTVQLLRYLVTTAAPQPITVLVTYRNAELAHDDALARLAADLEASGHAASLELSGLDRASVGDLVAAACPPTVDAANLTALVHAETDGNPFLAGEVIRHLLATDQLTAAASLPPGTPLSSLGIPETVRDLVRRRLRALPEGAQEVLPVAALIGRQFELDWLADALALDEDAVLAGLEAAEGAALVAESYETLGLFAFSHSLVQQSLCAELGPTRRQRWRVRIAESLERLCAEDPDARVEDLAACWLDAGDAPAAVSKAVGYARRAGERALARFAPDDSVRWYEAALGRLDRTTTLGADVRARVLVGLGDAQRQAGQREHRSTLLEAAHLAQELHDDSVLVDAVLANHRGYESVAGSVDEPRVEMLDAALASGAGTEPLTRARLLATLAAELAFAPDQAKTRALADEALAIARRSGDDATLLFVLGRRFLTILAPDTLFECLANSAEQLDLAERLGDPIATLFAAVYRANACLGVGDIRGTDAAIAIANQVTEVVRQPFLRHLVLTTQSWRTSLAGDLEAAERYATQALEIGLASGVPETRGTYAAQIFRAREAQGRLDELVPLLERSAQGDGALPSYRAVLCRAYCRLDRVEDARAIFDPDAARAFVDLPWDRFGLIGMAGYAEICEYLDEPGPARALYERMRPWHDQVLFSMVTCLGSVARHCGLLATTLCDFDAAEAYFREAETMNRRLDAPAFLAETWLEWSRMLLKRGDPDDRDRAVTLLDQSIAEADRIAYTPVATRARATRDELTAST